MLKNWLTKNNSREEKVSGFHPFLPSGLYSLTCQIDRPNNNVGDGERSWAVHEIHPSPANTFLSSSFPQISPTFPAFSFTLLLSISLCFVWVSVKPLCLTRSRLQLLLRGPEDLIQNIALFFWRFNTIPWVFFFGHTATSFSTRRPIVFVISHPTPSYLVTLSYCKFKFLKDHYHRYWI